MENRLGFISGVTVTLVTQSNKCSQMQFHGHEKFSMFLSTYI